MALALCGSSAIRFVLLPSAAATGCGGMSTAATYSCGRRVCSLTFYAYLHQGSSVPRQSFLASESFAIACDLLDWHSFIFVLDTHRSCSVLEGSVEKFLSCHLHFSSAASWSRLAQLLLTRTWSWPLAPSSGRPPCAAWPASGFVVACVRHHLHEVHLRLQIAETRAVLAPLPHQLGFPRGSGAVFWSTPCGFGTCEDLVLALAKICFLLV
jgi:hypothetical protein